MPTNDSAKKTTKSSGKPAAKSTEKAAKQKPEETTAASEPAVETPVENEQPVSDAENDSSESVASPEEVAASILAIALDGVGVSVLPDPFFFDEEAELDEIAQALDRKRCMEMHPSSGLGIYREAMAPVVPNVEPAVIVERDETTRSMGHLVELKKLYDAGILDEGEYTSKKGDILRRIY